MIHLGNSDRVRRQILAGPHVRVVLTVWETARCFVDWETGQIKLTRAELAKEAGVNPQQVSRAMTLLEQYGAIERDRDRAGVTYCIRPEVGWFGGRDSTYQRVAAAITEAFERTEAAEIEDPSLPMRRAAAE